MQPRKCLSAAATPRCRDLFRISCDSLSAAPIIVTPVCPARLPNTHFIQLHQAHQSIIPYRQPKAPEHLSKSPRTRKKYHRARLVFASPPPPCGSRSPGAGFCSLGNQMQPELPRAIHLGAAPATGTLPAILAILAILDRRKTDGRLMDGPCWARTNCCDAARPYFAAHRTRSESCALRQQAQQRLLTGKRPESPHHDPTTPSDSSGLTI